MVTKAVLALLVKYSTFLARKKKNPFLESTSKSTMTALKGLLERPFSSVEFGREKDERF